MANKNNVKKEMHLSGSDILRAVEAMAKKIPDKYNTWLLIGTNGFRIGAIMYNMIDSRIANRVNLAFIRAQRYKGKVRSPRIILSPILGRIEEPVLIIDDLVDEGDTVCAVKEKVKRFKADVAVIFKKPWSKVKPDYYVKDTDKWVIFPWERE